jgi:Ca-activated chloride channel family protein
VIPMGVPMDLPKVDGLRYQTPTAPSAASGSEELCLVKVRYKQPEGNVSSLMSQPVLDSRADFQELSSATRWAAAVACFGMLLKDSSFRGDTTAADIIRWANESMGDDSDGYRSQFVYLVGRYQELSR